MRRLRTFFAVAAIIIAIPVLLFLSGESSDWVRRESALMLFDKSKLLDPAPSPERFAAQADYIDYVVSSAAPGFGWMGRNDEFPNGTLRFASIEIPHEGKERELVYFEGKRKPGVYRLDERITEGEVMFYEFEIEGTELRWLDRDTKTVVRRTTCPILSEL